MKILYITNGYKPHRWAGTEAYTAGIAEEMAGRGHEVEILCAGGWDIGRRYWMGVSEDRQSGIRVRRINLNWAKAPDPFRYLYDNPVVGRYVADVLWEEKFDLVHVTSCETLSASVLQVVKDAGVPLVLSLTDFWMLCPRINLLHGNGSNCSGQTTPDECLACVLMGSGLYRKVESIVPEKSLLPVMRRVSQYPFFTRRRGLRGMAGDLAERKSLLRHALTLPDHRITASNFVRGVFKSNAVDAPIAVQPYGHDLRWMNSYKGKSDSDVLRLGYVGQIIESKGVHLIFQALKEVPSSALEGLSLVVYGNLNQSPAYGQQIRNLASGLPNVVFGGTYAHADSARVFSDIDVLLVPSLWFDFPLIIYEAFATRTPVIATNLAGMAEAISNNENGLLFDRGNVADLARQILRLINEPELLDRLRQGTPRVRTVSEEVDALEQKYVELVQARMNYSEKMGGL
jgi:glycosyltransferase involved in cell wall biosynthesis